MSDATQDEIIESFTSQVERQIKLCSGIGKPKMMEIIKKLLGESTPSNGEGKAGDKWFDYIKQFPVLTSFFESLGEVSALWLAQQIDIFAGKYPPQSPSVSPVAAMSGEEYAIGDKVPYINTASKICWAEITSFKTIERNNKQWFYGIDVKTKAEVYYPSHLSRNYFEAMSQYAASLVTQRDDTIRELKLEVDDRNKLIEQLKNEM